MRYLSVLEMVLYCNCTCIVYIISMMISKDVRILLVFVEVCERFGLNLWNFVIELICFCIRCCCRSVIFCFSCCSRLSFSCLSSVGILSKSLAMLLSSSRFALQARRHVYA